MKVLFTLIALTFTLSGWSSPDQVWTIKDRLRYELWYKGIQSQKKGMAVKRDRLPEELSRPLRTL